MTLRARFNSVSLTAIALAAVAGCATSESSAPQAKAGQVKLYIMCQMKPDAETTPLITATSRLTKLRDVLDVTAAKVDPTPATQPNTRVSTTVDLILTFADDAALERTKADPAYRSVIEDVLRPNTLSVNTAKSTLQDYQVSDRYSEETKAATLQRRAAAMKQQEDLRRQTK